MGKGVEKSGAGGLGLGHRKLVARCEEGGWCPNCGARGGGAVPQLWGLQGARHAVLCIRPSYFAAGTEIRSSEPGGRGRACKARRNAGGRLGGEPWDGMGCEPGWHTSSS